MEATASLSCCDAPEADARRWVVGVESYGVGTERLYASGYGLDEDVVEDGLVGGAADVVASTVLDYPTEAVLTECEAVDGDVLVVGSVATAEDDAVVRRPVCLGENEASTLCACRA